ncbi:hypothetical protein KGM_212027 [Danaus plexippus plexippus]|uniref:Tubulin polyglutamylase TTLL4-like n=1 Tax=Danaus plexippus plexippus TaxID=278856 RepID=A0A212F7R1_DANPL|nr:hypothetical protein KGM_212027 [Danaus plexippus plexippus]
MDGMRTCPSYEAGFEACDPLRSVFEWSGRGPARVLRRRCRSEGVDRSPYEDATRELHRPEYRQCRALNKSHFTLNNSYERFERFDHECSLPAENGDYVMAHESNLRHGYQPGRTKYQRTSPIRPLLVTTLSNNKLDDSRLPKVEELLEKVDQEMIEVPMTKQPLKSILNNPLPKTQPQSILKKPKNRSYQESKSALEGRRRQRASSESDNFYCSFHLGSSLPGYDGHLSYRSSNMKRAKDNSGTGYSYGTAIAALGNTPRAKSPTNYPKSRCNCQNQVIVTPKDEAYRVHLLRTSAINSETVNDVPVVDMPRQETHTPTRPAHSPALPVSSVTPTTVTKKKKKKKTKTKTTISTQEEADDSHSRSPSPDPTVDTWKMETETEVDKTDKQLHNDADKNPVVKLATKLNGTLVSPKKAASKESPLHLPESMSNCLRPSLFPRVPPYLKFISHDDTAPLKMPMAIQKHLKWKLTTITPIVVKKTLTNSGFRLVKSECDTSECPQEETVDWIGIWGKHMKSIMFRAIKDGQKMNHFPGTFQIGRKDRLWRNLQKLASRHGVSEFGIMPKTYVLPHDLKILKHDWEKYAANNEKWIIKPNGLPYDSRLYTVYLSKEERDKHIIYTHMEDRDLYLRDILSTLTPDDVRHLIQAEDELTQIDSMERVFPTKNTHKYLTFLVGPRYYNRLFDAWESRYCDYREPGIELLRNLCDIGYHLEVPPVPLKVTPSPDPSPRICDIGYHLEVPPVPLKVTPPPDPSPRSPHPSPPPRTSPARSPPVSRPALALALARAARHLARAAVTLVLYVMLMRL